MFQLRIVLLLFWLRYVLAVDFCNMTECKEKPHLGCNNDLTFHRSCMRTHVLVNMQIYEDYLVKIHNKYRNDVASGIIRGLPKAQQMPELLWHSKLALLAEYHVKRCLNMLTNYCVSLTNFTEPGVNYGLNWLNVESNSNYRPRINSNKITLQVDQWMHQVYSLANPTPYDEEVYEIRNILNDRNFFLGCAAAEDYDRRNSRFVLICYYGAKYEWGTPVYQKGTFLPINCPRNRSDNYAHLCKPYKDIED
ncbi:allergen Tab y 5.0101 [Drosophila innubila]|uniref:allergen Tab y 5.0101 n=1 Tax=Drosophila innubila TaxID=198719 RepID=UPI00148DEEA7|nr:allergen Tab y 5.0101 [Drosophila innubila]